MHAQVQQQLGITSTHSRPEAVCVCEVNVRQGGTFGICAGKLHTQGWAATPNSEAAVGISWEEALGI